MLIRPGIRYRFFPAFQRYERMSGSERDSIGMGKDTQIYQQQGSTVMSRHIIGGFWYVRKVGVSVRGT
jgi:hypothetical protein